MQKLYYSPGACSLAAHIVLEWIGEPYEAVQVDLHHLPKDYLEINPAGAVPALDVGGERPMTQNGAILSYLAETHPGADLLDHASPERAADFVKWTSFLTGDLHPAFWPVFGPERYTTATDDASLANVKEAAFVLVRKQLGLLDAQLGSNDWIVGGKRTIVDAYATPMLNWAVGMLPGGLMDYPNLRAHRARMQADPAVQRAMAAEGLKPDSLEQAS